MRDRYRFAVIGYVVMPEHVHLVISEPIIDPWQSLNGDSGCEAGRLPATGHAR
jgi:REP element-mobilizing transposase RayT